MILVALLVVVQATAQDPRLERVDPGARPLVVALVDSARAASLPGEPLVQRALEGTTKRASPDRIVAALRRLAADLGRARDALGAGAATPELEAGAAALRAGVSPGVLAQLRRTRHPPLTIPLAVLADLVASGVPPDSAAAAVLLLADRVRDADLVEFRRAVERDIALGVAPSAAAAVDAAPLVNNSVRGGDARPRRP